MIEPIVSEDLSFVRGLFRKNLLGLECLAQHYPQSFLPSLFTSLCRKSPTKSWRNFSDIYDRTGAQNSAWNFHGHKVTPLVNCGTKKLAKEHKELIEMEEEIESTNQFVQFVLRIVCPVSETGRIEQWIEDKVFGAKVIFAKKYPKTTKIRIVEEGSNGNGVRAV